MVYEGLLRLAFKAVLNYNKCMDQQLYCLANPIPVVFGSYRICSRFSPNRALTIFPFKRKELALVFCSAEPILHNR